MRRSVATLAAALLGFGLAAGSVAAGPLTLSLTATNLTHDTATAITHKKGIGITAGYDLPFQLLSIKGSTLAIEAAVMTNSGDGGHLKSAGLELVQRVPLGGPKMPYIGIGIGAANLQGKATFTSGGGGGGYSSTSIVQEDGIRGTVRAIVGAKIEGSIFTEVFYLFRGKVGDVPADIIGISLGTRL